MMPNESNERFFKRRTGIREIFAIARGCTDRWRIWSLLGRDGARDIPLGDSGSSPREGSREAVKTVRLKPDIW